MTTHAAPSRVGILGNPSDGFGGRTLALALPQYQATVTLEPAERVEFVGLNADETQWPSFGAMTDHLDRYGYGTGPQLLAATARTFVGVAESLDHRLESGFRLSYETTIPRQVGLGGSSALVIATLRCLAEHYHLELADEILPSLALQTETTQLGLGGGLQGRVVQTYGGLMAMDFSNLQINTQFGVSYGAYESEDPSCLPPLFLAFRAGTAEPTDTYRQQLRIRYETGDTHVRETLRELAALVVEGRAALRWRDRRRFSALIGKNMQLRQSLGPVPSADLELVDTARSVGANVTCAGSGCAVVGAFEDDRHFELLSDAYADIGVDVVRVEGLACPEGNTPSDDRITQGNVVTLERRHH